MTDQKKALTQEQLDKNKAMILKLLGSVNRSGMDGLIKYIEDGDFFMAPASTKYHCCYEGGLSEHSLNVLQRLAVNKAVTIERDSKIICALLHDLCKAGVYHRIKKNVKDGMTVKNGRPAANWIEVDAWEFDDAIPLGHGEKSVFLISTFIPLTFPEIAMIRWHMGPENGDNSSFYKACTVWPEVLALHNADMEATYYLEAAPPEAPIQN